MFRSHFVNQIFTKRVYSFSTTSAQRPAPSALTLIEMLIGMAITLVMMAAVVNLFANIGSGVTFRRSGMEMNAQLRLVRARLYKDLAGATCAARPKLPSDDHDDGYIEIIDGAWSDANPSVLMDGDLTNGELDYSTSLVPSAGDPNEVLPALSTTNAVTNGGGLGDYDCVLALTVRSQSEPFRGRGLEWKDPDGTGPEPADWYPTTIESDLAEVIWYAVENPADGSLGEPGMRTVYRRVLLIAPWVELPPLAYYGYGTADENILAHYRYNDVSTQVYTTNNAGILIPNTTTNLVPNTLADLTKRENRFAHNNGLAWPYWMYQDQIRQSGYDPDSPPAASLGPLRPFGEPFEPSTAFEDPYNNPERTGEDLMLNNVLAWDLRVYDPGAPLVEIAGLVLEPSDIGWDPTGGPIVGFGAYVSLGWDHTVPPRYVYNPATGAPAPLFQEIRGAGWHPRYPQGYAFGLGNFATYDTWSFHYENDGIDQDNFDGDDNATTGADEGTNGLDDNNINGVDDASERETSPPYDVPLRGIQVKLRIYEPDSRQIREATVTKNLVPN